LRRRHPSIKGLYFFLARTYEKLRLAVIKGLYYFLAARIRSAGSPYFKELYYFLATTHHERRPEPPSAPDVRPRARRQAVCSQQFYRWLRPPPHVLRVRITAANAG
jgi:hypothetical protein